MPSREYLRAPRLSKSALHQDGRVVIDQSRDFITVLPVNPSNTMQAGEDTDGWSIGGCNVPNWKGYSVAIHGSLMARAIRRVHATSRRCVVDVVVAVRRDGELSLWLERSGSVEA